MALSARHSPAVRAVLFAIGVACCMAACGTTRHRPKSAARCWSRIRRWRRWRRVTAYAGEIRAREESALSFRVGGNLVRREVDVGDEVKRGQLLAELDPGDLRLQAQAAQAQFDRGRSRTRPRQRRSRALREARAAAAGQPLHAGCAGCRACRRRRPGQGRARATGCRPQPGRLRAIARAARRRDRRPPGRSRPGRRGRADRSSPLPAMPVAKSRSHCRKRASAISVSASRSLVELWNAPGPALARHDPRDRARRRSAGAHLCRAHRAGPATAAEAVELGQSARVYVLRRRPMRRRCACRCRRCSAAPTARRRYGWSIRRRARCISTPVRLGAFGADSAPVLAGIDPDALDRRRRWTPAARRPGGRAGRSRQPARRLRHRRDRGEAEPCATSTCPNGRCATARWCSTRCWCWR